jgi:hypothetical protein
VNRTERLQKLTDRITDAEGEILGELGVSLEVTQAFGRRWESECLPILAEEIGLVVAGSSDVGAEYDRVTRTPMPWSPEYSSMLERQDDADRDATRPGAVEGGADRVVEQHDSAWSAELHAAQDAALARLTGMKLTDDEAHLVVGALAFSAPVAFQKALDIVQRHRDEETA